MLFILETTTGRLLSHDLAPGLPRGTAGQAFIQFRTAGVAGLLPDGTVITLKLYRPHDRQTVLSSVTGFAVDGDNLLYRGAFAAMFAAASYGSLLAQIGWGANQSEWLMLNLDQLMAAAAAPSSAPASTILLGSFGGAVLLNQVEGGWVAPARCTLSALTLNCQDAPTGADLLVDLVINGIAQGAPVALAAGGKLQSTVYVAPFTLETGDILKFKPTQIGSLKPGTNLTVQAKIALL